MPIKIPDSLPAYDTLVNENIFVMHEQRAIHQDIRPLKVAIMNLMPAKITTETQILRLIGNSPLQVETVLLHPKSHVSKNTPQEHLLTFYRHFDDIKDEKFDGLIITGAPVETLEFHEVDYWDELIRVMEWSKTNVFSTFHICWGAPQQIWNVENTLVLLHSISAGELKQGCITIMVFRNICWIKRSPAFSATPSTSNLSNYSEDLTILFMFPIQGVPPF